MNKSRGMEYLVFNMHEQAFGQFLKYFIQYKLSQLHKSTPLSITFLSFPKESTPKKFKLNYIYYIRLLNVIKNIGCIQ